jgi:hypothetical protein
MQTKLDFSVSKYEAFKAFIETKKADGYQAEKINYVACATILKKDFHRISICKSNDGRVCVTEYEVSGRLIESEIIAHKNPDDFREPRSFQKWKLIRSYTLSA